MNIEGEILDKVKHTQSVSVYGNTSGLMLRLIKEAREIWIPMRVVHQIKRGLETYTQKFYRRKKK